MTYICICREGKKIEKNREREREREQNNKKVTYKHLSKKCVGLRWFFPTCVALPPRSMRLGIKILRPYHQAYMVHLLGGGWA